MHKDWEQPACPCPKVKITTQTITNDNTIYEKTRHSYKNGRDPEKLQLIDPTSISFIHTNMCSHEHFLLLSPSSFGLTPLAVMFPSWLSFGKWSCIYAALLKSTDSSTFALFTHWWQRPTHTHRWMLLWEQLGGQYLAREHFNTPAAGV